MEEAVPESSTAAASSTPSRRPGRCRSWVGTAAAAAVPQSSVAESCPPPQKKRDIQIVYFTKESLITWMVLTRGSKGEEQKVLDTFHQSFEGDSSKELSHETVVHASHSIWKGFL